MNFGFGGFPGGGFGGGHSHGGRGQRKEVDNGKYYEWLGIDKTASEAEIKKAFRKQAMQHHPDKGGDEAKFKEVSKAYEVLSDPEKRQLYDEGGEEALQDGGGGGGGVDIFDLFGGGMFGGMGGGGRRGQKRKGDDVVFPLAVTLDDLYNGTSKKLRLTKNVLCKDCKGKGGKGEGTCRDCKGQGVRVVIRQIGPGMIQQMQQPCGACKGSGSQIAEKDKCKTCHGEKTVKEKKTLEVFVSKGMKHGERIAFNGEADEAPDTVPGDVVVVLQQKEHPTFKREGPNLFYKKTLTLLEALTGFSFTIAHLDGRQLLVKSEPGVVVKPKDFKAIINEGFPQHKNPYVKGNLYIEFDVTFPTNGSLTDAHKKLLASILPGPAAGATNGTATNGTTAAGDANMETGGEGAEEVTLVDVDIEAEKRKFEQQERQNRREEEDDDDDRRGGGGQPGCRAQ